MKKLRALTYRQFAGVLIMLTGILLTGSCTKDNSTGSDGTDGTGGSKGPGANEVYIQNMAFNPSTITITAGTTVKWTNKDGIAHTVTSSTGVFNSGSVAPDGTFSFTFTAAGTYPYFCTFHPNMTGTVKVNAGSGY